ncbi:acyltransferase family protein [Salaquimonas pukyongi]|uniref:acyltransferase family protein n=1 Tax=Salaquimonas pukyongi TaxID=2712698 RepID=UPI0009F99A35|nr:acyltransferase [Salaquimonas pukyongi]
MTTSTPKMETIQVLRAAAVLCVVISHIAHELAALLVDRVDSFNSKLFPGDFGVDLFFVISGFLMTYTCWDIFGKPRATSNFMARRLIRIVPLYWVTTSLMIAVVVLFPGNVKSATSDWQQWLSSYLFWPYARETDGLIRPVFGLGWSLQYEVLFYIIFAIGLCFSRTKGLIFIAGTIVASSLLARIFGGNTAEVPAIIRFLSHTISLEFLAGMLLGYLYMKGLRFTRGIGLGIGSLGLILLLVVPNFNESIDQMRAVHYGIPATLMVFAAVLTKGYDEVRVPRLALEIGESSYAIYLTHPFIIGATSVLFSRLQLIDGLFPLNLVFTYSLAVVIMSLAVGYLAHYLFDLPFTNWLRRRWFAKAMRVYRVG